MNLIVEIPKSHESHVFERINAMKRILILGVTAPYMILMLPSLAFSAQPPWHKVRPVQIADQVQEIKNAVGLVGLQDKLTVKGTYKYKSSLILTKKLIFEPSSRLVFTRDAWKKNQQLIIAAMTVANKDPTHPGVITWATGPGPGVPPPIAGQAPGGANGVGQGQSGGKGGAGDKGRHGRSGADAPSLTVFVEHITGGPLRISLKGQDGGQGGKGQTGGAGGVGRQGAPASENFFNCTRGPGQGGNGGDGGPGGPGGKGGNGGNGGTFTLVSVPDAVGTIKGQVNVVVSGGHGGPGGLGGVGGLGGPPGRAGDKALPFCHARPDRHGQAGHRGAVGPTGNPGDSGQSGSRQYSPLNKKYFERLFGN